MVGPRIEPVGVYIQSFVYVIQVHDVNLDKSFCGGQGGGIGGGTPYLLEKTPLAF